MTMAAATPVTAAMASDDQSIFMSWVLRSVRGRRLTGSCGHRILSTWLGLMVTSAESLTLLLDTGARREIE